MRTGFDAIVIGAGPAGSTAAILLARAGWSVALIEKRPFPRRKVCGECIAASNLPLLHALGIGSPFEADAGPELRRVALMRGDRTALATLPAAGDPRYPWGRALGRETLDTLLMEQARAVGAQVLQPWSAQALDGAAGNFRCQVRAIGSDSTLTLRAPIAIAAHGSWEALPQGRAARRVARRRTDLFAFKANFRDVTLEEGLLPVLSFDGGYGGMVVADRGLATVACCIWRDRIEACRRVSPGSAAGEAIEGLLRSECQGVRLALQGARREGAWLASGPIDPGIRLRADDDLLRIGNAAGEAHPIIGEGISMALQSAWLLCGRLTAREARDHVGSLPWQREVARWYAGEWRRRFTPRLRLAAAFAHSAMRPVTAVPLLALVRAFPGLLTMGARWGGKVDCAVDPSTPGTALAGATGAQTPGLSGSSNPSDLP